MFDSWLAHSVKSILREEAVSAETPHPSEEAVGSSTTTTMRARGWHGCWLRLATSWQEALGAHTVELYSTTVLPST